MKAAFAALDAGGVAFEEEEGRRHALASDAAWSMMVQNISTIVNFAPEDSGRGAVGGGSGINTSVRLSESVRLSIVSAQKARNVDEARLAEHYAERFAAAQSNARREKLARRHASQDIADKKRYEAKFDVDEEGSGLICKRCHEVVARSMRGPHLIKCRGPRAVRKARRKERKRRLTEERNGHDEIWASTLPVREKRKQEHERELEVLQRAQKETRCPLCDQLCRTAAQLRRHGRVCAAAPPGSPRGGGGDAAKGTVGSDDRDAYGFEGGDDERVEEEEAGVVGGGDGTGGDGTGGDGTGGDGEGYDEMDEAGEADVEGGSSSASPTPRCAWCNLVFDSASALRTHSCRRQGTSGHCVTCSRCLAPFATAAAQRTHKCGGAARRLPPPPPAPREKHRRAERSLSKARARSRFPVTTRVRL